MELNCSKQDYVLKVKKKKTRNKFEARLLRALKKAKVGVKYEAEKIPYVIAGHYNPDYTIITPRGKIYIEAKGYFRPEAKRKMAAVKRQHPELDIRIIFYKKKASDVKWAERNGFSYAFEAVPDEWLL